MRRQLRSTLLKFTAFALTMTVLTVFLFLIFGQYRTGSEARYFAIFADVSRLGPGDSVRVAGVRVGTVDEVTVQPDKTVVVKFDADRNVVLTTGTRAAVRYLNLVGDRYLELVDAPGSTRIQPPGSTIPVSRTEPALDLDLLLGGLKPVIQGLNPRDINALTGSLIQIFQGQGDTLSSLMEQTSTLTNALADNSQTIQQLIDNLNAVSGTVAGDNERFSTAVDRLQRLVTALSKDRDPIGVAIDSLDNGTASLASLLTAARPPLAGTIDQLNRVAPLLQQDQPRLDLSLQKLPENYRKLIRIGAYGSMTNGYICGLAVRVTDLQGRTVVFPWIKQETGRCAEP